MQNSSTPMTDQHFPADAPLLCALIGPTASGKSELALRMAEELGCGILSVDAMQVYRHLDTGTAKPTTEERARVPHYGLDLVSPLENFSASRFVEYAEPLLEETLRRERPLILCGGTGLYFRALLQGLFNVPDPDPQVREHLRSRFEAEGSQALHAELTQIDPETARGIHPNDARRISRALEIIQQTGRSVTALRAEQRVKPWFSRTRFLGIFREKEDMRRRIERRTQWMYSYGLIDETKFLLDIGCDSRHTAFQALGYKECAKHLKGGLSLEEAKRLTSLHSIQYAKRQMTWFRFQFPTKWVTVREEEPQQEILSKFLQVWGYSDNKNTI